MASVEETVRQQLKALMKEESAAVRAELRRRVDTEAAELQEQWRARIDEAARRAALPTSGSRRLVMPMRPLIIHVPDSQADGYTETLRAPFSGRIEAVIASTTDLAAGARACYVEYGPEGEASPLVSPLVQPNTADAPLLGEVFCDSMKAAVELDRCGFAPPLVGISLKLDQRLVFKVRDAFGTPPYDVRVLVYMSRTDAC